MVDNTSQTGRCWVLIVLQITKYGLVDIEGVQTNIKRLTNQLWKLIPMRENEEDWKKQLDTVVLEITGINEIFMIDAVLLQLLSKLEGLREVDTSFDLYRKTVFETISLLQEFGRGFRV